MKKTDTFKIEIAAGTGNTSAAISLVCGLTGVEWSGINSAAAELTVTYDDCWITRSGIASALRGIGVICKIFAAPAKPSNDTDTPESRAAQKIRLRKQERRRECLRSPKPVCRCC
jgi:hypothetical protein